MGVLFEKLGCLLGQMIGKLDYLYVVFVDVFDVQVGDLVWVWIWVSFLNLLVGELVV